jgi:GntR family transcriptional regulator/MocR family aminotransferase
VTAGTHAAVLLVAEVLCRPGSVAWMEEPGYFRMRMALQAAGLAPVAVAIDKEGISVVDGRRLAPKAALAAVTSSYQFPIGTPLSERRKQELTDWSADVGSFILEDDFGCEARAPRSAAVPLAARADAQRVVYMNTFTTTIFPSLRLSYLIVPRAVTDRFAEAVRRTERYATIPNQIVLADFIASGHFAKHIRRCREAYAERGDALRHALRDECQAFIDGDPSMSGMHLCIRLKPGIDDVAVTAAAREIGLLVEPLSSFYAEAPRVSGLVLGFAAFRPEALNDAAKRLGRLLREHTATPDRAASA